MPNTSAKKRKQRTLPGYGAAQVRELEETISRISCDVVLIATPVDLGRISTIKQSIWRVPYRFEEQGTLGFRDVIRAAF